jgi:hypothetical protein
MRRRFVILLLLFAWANPLSAQEANQTSPASAPSTEGKKVKVGRTVYDFDEVDILGKLKSPEGQSIVEPPEFRFRRLLDLDESFLPNIVRSVDEY